MALPSNGHSDSNPNSNRVGSFKRRRSGCSRPFKALCLLATVFLLCHRTAYSQEFNYEVEKRVLERLGDFLGNPVAINRLIHDFRVNGGFPNNMQAPDRDLYLRLAYSVSQPLIYYALEDGSISGYYLSNGYYREPGSSGYSVNDPDRSHLLNSCIDNDTGAPKQCKLAPGAQYIKCDQNRQESLETSLCPVLAVCPDQPTCTNTTNTERCLKSQKLCHQYSIVSAPEDQEDTEMGYIPLTNHCIDIRGQFSEKVDATIDPSSVDRDDPNVNLKTCTYGDGTTSVQRSISGPYGYCGGQECDATFLGGYASFEYDPRYRPWYIQVKEKQKSVFSLPYPFFSLGIGVTYGSPLYSSDEQGRPVFAGVIAIDYQFENIVDFLVANYGDTATSVFIYEDNEPNYLIGSSTGSAPAKNFLTEDLTVPCPVDRGDEVPCTPVRTKMSELNGNPMDPVLVEVFKEHSSRGYPRDVLSVTIDSGEIKGVFISQSTIYEQQGMELIWRVIVVAPGAQSEIDAATIGSDVFIPLCLAGGVGFLVCLLFLLILYTKRTQKAIMFADWRFTCAFVFGCVLLNVSTFTLLGKNTDELCLLRMWSFHLFLAFALAPLFVKVWRIRQLVGQGHIMQRKRITNFQAALYTMPMIIGQVVILMVFTFVDPPRRVEFIENIDGVITQRAVCQTESNAFFITSSIYEAGFVFSGCILAYMTRHLGDDFGEAKQLIFAMYNIALVGIITVLVVRLTDLSGNALSLMQAIGILWGTVFSTAAFVIPRMIQVRQQTTGRGNSNTYISGMERSRPSATVTDGGEDPRPNEAESDDDSDDDEDSNEDSNEDSISDITSEIVTEGGIEHPEIAKEQFGSGAPTIGIDDVSSDSKSRHDEQKEPPQARKSLHIDWTGALQENS